MKPNFITHFVSTEMNSRVQSYNFSSGYFVFQASVFERCLRHIPLSRTKH